MKKGFTLVEVLIAISLFTLASIIATDILADVVKLRQRSAVQNNLYEDARVIIQQLTKEIEAGSVDYEEYYSMAVIQENNVPEAGPFYGINYGVYASRFYDPGKSADNQPTSNPRDLGIECSVPFGNDFDGTYCDIIWTNSIDLNQGKFPYNGLGSEANAFCQNPGDPYCDAIVDNQVTVDQLYLIDKTGSKKTMIARKLVQGDDYVLGLMRMNGQDLDQNGLIDIFTCDDDFACYGDDNNIDAAILYPFANEEVVRNNNVRVPQSNDLEEILDPNTTQFIPISPLRSNLKDLKFIIRPLDDPFRAYAEKEMQAHPSITIVMTLGLSAEAEADYPGDFEDIVIQTTVAVGANEEIKSYPAVNDYIRSVNAPNDGNSWIFDVLEPAGLSD